MTTVLRKMVKQAEMIINMNQTTKTIATLKTMSKHPVVMIVTMTALIGLINHARFTRSITINII